MKIIPPPQDLIFHHRQPGRRIVAIACFAIGLVAAFKTSIVSEISCQQTGAAPNCSLTYRSLSGLTLENDVQIKAVKNPPICLHPPLKWTLCHQIAKALETQRGEVYILGMETDILAVNQFVNKLSSPSLKVEVYGWSLNYPQYNIWFFVLPFVMLRLISVCLRYEKIYRCQFDRSSGWVTITYTQPQGKKVTVSEFAIADIETVNLRRSLTENLVLKLKSGQQVQIAEALRIPTQTNRSLEQGCKAITEFLQ